MARPGSVSQQRPITSNADSATTAGNSAAASGLVVTQSTAFKIVSSREAVRYMRALLYGEYGSGKTWLGGSSVLVPEMRDVLYLPIEAGSMTLDAFLPYEIDEIPLTSYSQIARIVEYLALHCRLRDEGSNESVARMRQYEARLRGVDESEIEKPKQYRTVVFDSFSEVQKLVIYQLLGTRIETAKVDSEPDAMEIQQWGKMTEMMRLLVRTVKSLPINAIFICPEERIYGGRNEEGALQEIRPLFDGRKLVREINGYFDIVGYLMSGEDENMQTKRRLWLRTPQNALFKAKNRLRDNVPFIDDPTMAKLYKASIG